MHSLTGALSSLRGAPLRQGSRRVWQRPWSACSAWPLALHPGASLSCGARLCARSRTRASSQTTSHTGQCTRRWGDCCARLRTCQPLGEWTTEMDMDVQCALPRRPLAGRHVQLWAVRRAARAAAAATLEMAAVALAAAAAATAAAVAGRGPAATAPAHLLRLRRVGGMRAWLPAISLPSATSSRLRFGLPYTASHAALERCTCTACYTSLLCCCSHDLLRTTYVTAGPARFAAHAVAPSPPYPRHRVRHSCVSLRNLPQPTRGRALARAGRLLHPVLRPERGPGARHGGGHAAHAAVRALPE